ncbi:DoxX-like family protein [Pedobacter cryotolerans]|uniref:DoxX-like family protein n=1 Tax=Pedobacter cryotolerans TaxID=2571270 RepID=A0A4U1C1Q3_9SPHI|nr:DoxX-like family protein [Pedobacter cryotolerans]TKB98045.1 hypothetical protein FA045_15405 [Pedobacter cryotolerans]
MKFLNLFVNFAIAMVWFINGFFCKVLNLAPRHQAIVGKALSQEYAVLLTKTIGILEVLLAIWILTRLQPKLTTLFQLMLIASMNIIEFFLAPELLLFGKLNIIFAIIFMGIIYANQCYHQKELQSISQVPNN